MSLGLKARQLNGDAYYPQTGQTANQLESWNHIGLFAPSIDVDALSGILTSKNVEDEGASLEERALSYLDSNCASCHRPDGGPRSEFDLRLNVPLENSKLIDEPVIEDLGIEGARVIVPGDPDKSILYQRLTQLGTATAMPPLAKNKLDDDALELIRDWIISMPPLPVELADFSGVADGNRVHLRWETLSELNNAGFDVERLVTGSGQTAWVKIGFVEGYGTTTVAQHYTFVDAGIPDSDGLVNYRLKQIDFDGTIEYSEVITVELAAPAGVALHDNYPDPFNPTTTIAFDLPVESYVRLHVYDMQGRMVRELVNEERSAGQYEIAFDASNLASGTYLYRLQTGDKVLTKPMVLLK